jgi:hypothetical protein
MNVELVYFDDCPNWRFAQERLGAALENLGRHDVEVRLHRVASPAEAESAGMHGSPTILVNGRAPFPHTSNDTWSCRLYRNGERLEGSPSVLALVEALR